MESDTPDVTPSKRKAIDVIEKARKAGYNIIEVVDPETGQIRHRIGMHKDHNPNNSLAKIPGVTRRSPAGRDGGTYADDETLQHEEY